ncbi:hypothetical protein Sipo8835_29545 [Streptomyces ipomoeae]|uniref:Secreted protein n=2 Tax=Streptomyces ipomoeae TaxID=103232 RepID=A0AAE9AXR9_9ACTN|nr:hypothetical protein Sipo8835_29545 [Streptomyces ipomoeae]
MMNKLKTAAAVAVMVGGTALGGAVTSHADDNPAIGSFCAVIGSGADDDRRRDDEADVVIGNLQAVECNQDFKANIGPVED